jgi:DNA-binding transcriptional ArsR family regulator
VTDEFAPVVLDDPGRLRALSHPLRRQILHQLRLHGSATSTTIGAALGANTGTTSYHLRQLEKHGFIQEIPERSTGRERWWRQVDSPRDVRIPPMDALPPEDRPVLVELLQQQHAEDVDLLQRLPQAYTRDPRWARLSRGFTHLTQEELDAFFEAYVALLQRHGHRREEAPAGARPVYVRLFALPADDG